MDYDYEQEEANASTKLTYLLIGGGIGAILALLFAPKSGQELRDDIADVTMKGIEKSKETAEQIQDAAGDYYEVTRERANELYSTAQERAGEISEKAKSTAEGFSGKAKSAAAQTANPISAAIDAGSAAIDAGKEAYQDEKRKNESKAITEGRPAYPVEDEVLEVPKKKETKKKN